MKRFVKQAGFWCMTTVLVSTSVFSYHPSGIASHILRNQQRPDGNQIEETKILDPSLYQKPEVLVSYLDGTYEVKMYSNKKALKEGLKCLSKEKTVEGIQPNYSYESVGAVVSDTNFSEQWALNNDGTFSVEDDIERFPVYTDPFEDPIEDFMKFFDDVGFFDDIDFFNDINSIWDWMDKQQFQKYSTDDLIDGLRGVKAKAGVDVDIQKAWSDYHGGNRDTIVAVIDTGIDYNHEDLKDAIWVNAGETAGDGIDNDGNGFVDDVYGWNFYDNNNQVYVGSEDSHGTHGAGTIAATRNNSVGVAGIAGNSKVKIMIIKVLGGDEGSGSTAAILKAIQYAKNNGASICNLSFGTNANDLALKKAIANSNMLFIAAAGNGNHWTGKGVDDDKQPTYPAAYGLENMISVANLNFDGNLHYSSNYGMSTVDLAAPGSYVLSTTPQNTYSYMTGTSMAAPMVTGVAAMIYSQYKDVTLNQVKQMIIQSVKPLDSLNNKVKTGGMLDASAAFHMDYSSLKKDWTTLDQNEDSEKQPSKNIKSDGKQKNKNVKSSPKISVKLSYGPLRNIVMTLKVEESSDSVKNVYYGKGILKAKDFKDLSSYTKVKLDSNKSAYFEIRKGGIYTFYVKDSKGHEAVQTYKLLI